MMDALVRHLPWSCHSQDLLGVFHQLPSAVFPKEPHLIACACGNSAAAEGWDCTERSQGTGLTKIQSLEDMNELKAPEPLSSSISASKPGVHDVLLTVAITINTYLAPITVVCKDLRAY